jgi:hypothetical protein
VAWAIFFVGLLLNAAAIGQSQAGNSLADAARANRAKQQAEQAAGSTPKVITNQDIPSAPPDMPESSEPMTTVSGVKQFTESYSDQHANQRLLAEERSSSVLETADRESGSKDCRSAGAHRPRKSVNACGGGHGTV